MNIQIIAKTVPAIIVVFGCLGIAISASYGWPLMIIGVLLFAASLSI